jgi:hypothetical protein
MAQGWYRAMAASVLSLHAVDIAWVTFGAFLHAGPAAARHAARCHMVYGVITKIFCSTQEYLEFRNSHRTIFGARVLVYTTVLAANWNKFSFYWDMFRCRPLKSTSVANSDSEKLSMTRSGLSRAHEIWS